MGRLVSISRRGKKSFISKMVIVQLFFSAKLGLDVNLLCSLSFPRPRGIRLDDFLPLIETSAKNRLEAVRRVVESLDRYK